MTQGKMLQRLLELCIAVVAITMVLYHLVATQILLLGPTMHLHTHLSFAFVLALLIFIAEAKRRKYVWIVALIASLLAILYVYVFFDALEQRSLFNTPLDLVIGAILVILALVICWKGFGPVLPVFASICILYFALCYYIPGPFHGPDYPLFRLIPSLSIGLSGGMYGLVLSVSANMIFLFMIFGGLLQASGATQFFTELGRLAGRKLAGGPAITSVIGSALVGMCTGSGAANVVITGAFTIPAMKKAGYSSNEAGAVEAAASTGGQIMPPVMGVAAFGLSAVTGIPYLKIIMAAALPAIIYFFSVGLVAQFWAMKRPVSKVLLEESIDIHKLMVGAPCFILPLTILIILLALDHSPQYSACWTIASLFIVTSIRKETRFTLSKLREGLTKGAYGGAQICAASATIGFIITTFGETGLSLKLPSLIENLAGGNLLAASILTFLISLIVGCGMPTMATYFTVALISAPILIMMGVPLLSAHLFVLYAGVFSYLTPPVAISSLVASRVAGGNFVNTSVKGLRLIGVAYILPFLILLCPLLILEGDATLLNWMKVADCFFIVLSFSIALERHWLKTLSLGQWLLSFLGLLLGFAFLINFTYWTFLVAIGAFILLTIWQSKEKSEVSNRVYEY